MKRDQTKQMQKLLNMKKNSETNLNNAQLEKQLKVLKKASLK